MRTTRNKTNDGVETTIHVQWFAATGYFTVQAVGLGPDTGIADSNARLMLGQARAQLIQETGEADKLGVLADLMGPNV
jgi:hypothetical protein